MGLDVSSAPVVPCVSTSSFPLSSSSSCFLFYIAVKEWWRHCLKTLGVSSVLFFFHLVFFTVQLYCVFLFLFSTLFDIRMLCNWHGTTNTTPLFFPLISILSLHLSSPVFLSLHEAAPCVMSFSEGLGVWSTPHISIPRNQPFHLHLFFPPRIFPAPVNTCLYHSPWL